MRAPRHKVQKRVSYTELTIDARMMRAGFATLRYDLHSHSTISDGTLSPTDLVRYAALQEVDVLALTDHDATSGIAEGLRVAAEEGVILVPGVEISVTWGHQLLHIVGLGIDPDNDVLQRGLTGLREFRVWRAEEMGRRLEKKGIAEAYAGAQAQARGPSIGRTHFARYLVAQGKAKNVQDAFDRFLLRGKPGYVPGQWATLGDAVAWIRAAGGQAVIAHPARYSLSAGRLRELLQEFKDSGGEAIEVVSGSAPHGATPALANFARHFALLASAGSDYHGSGQPHNKLGCLPPLPEASVPVWERWNLQRPQPGAANP